MATINYTIPDNKVQKVIDTMKWLYPVPLDVTTGLPLFTDQAWAKEALRRYVRDMVAKHEVYLLQQAANVVPDDTLIT